MSYLTVICDTLPEAWEQAVLRCWEEGDRIRTEYDKPSDPESRDCTVMIVARNPFQEPRIHKAFPGSLEDLEVYRQEVVLGIHDHWVDPAAGKWSYTYHQRLFAYEVTTTPPATTTSAPPDAAPGVSRRAINQFDYIINKLSTAPHTRRAQAITWKPDVDPTVDDPACLQRMWFRIYGDELRMNVHMRSNDAYKAAFMNMWAFTDLQRHVAEAVTRRTGRALRPGPYAHIVDSFHIYGSYFREFEGFLQSLRKRSFADRTWDSTSEIVQGAFDSARARIAQERGNQAASGRLPE
jgi:thymidylate synthase